MIYPFESVRDSLQKVSIKVSLGDVLILLLNINFED